MASMDLVDTSTLEKSRQYLALALKTYGEHREETIGEVLRSGVVQSFNVCWGRIRPALTRALVRLDGLDPEAVKVMSLGQILRTANEYGYSTVEWAQWKAFLDARNESAHTYNEAVADSIVEQAPRLVEAAGEMLAAIRRKELP